MGCICPFLHYRNSKSVNIKLRSALWKKGALFSQFHPLAPHPPPPRNLIECAAWAKLGRGAQGPWGSQAQERSNIGHNVVQAAPCAAQRELGSKLLVVEVVPWASKPRSARRWPGGWLGEGPFRNEGWPVEQASRRGPPWAPGQAAQAAASWAGRR